MKKVDVIRPGSLYQIIGPVATLKRILSARDYFLSEGIDVSIYNRGNFYQTIDQLAGDNKGKAYGKKHSLFEFLQRKAKNSYLLSVLLVEYKFRSIKKVVDSYLKLNRTPDVVVMHAEPESFWFIKALKSKNDASIKTAVFYHNDCIPFVMYLLYYPKLKGTLYWKLMMKRYDYIVNNADKLCFICEAGMKNMNRLYPQSISKSFLIVNGITDFTSDEDCEVCRIRKGRNDSLINLCCVGSVTVRKAQRKVIEALSLLPIDKLKMYHLTIVGGGTDLEYCKQCVLDRNLDSYVTLTGAVPNTEVYKYLASSDVFVLLSENEGLPISIIEAMRAGLAIVSTNVSGIPELVSNDNGVLINSNAEAFAKVLLNDNYNWKQMGNNSRALFEEKFTFKRMREDYVRMIKSMI